jgi:LmbE family N-acetylglucosaminyl deacetylase
MSKTVLALVPHPDDAEFSAGGTLARFAAEGARVLIAVATDGGAGSLHHDTATLVRLRAEESRRAAAVLGAEPPILLGHPDGGLDLLPAGTLREQFTRLIRTFRPDVVIAQDPFAPYEVHPDHRAVAWAASDAANFAQLPLFYPEHRQEGLEPHFVVEKYWYGSDPAAASRIVDIGATIDKKVAAIAAHESQVQFLIEDLMLQARLAGVDLQARLGESAADPVAAIAWAIRQEAAAAGQRGGLAFGEAFRYSRFHPFVESLLAQKDA